MGGDAVCGEKPSFRSRRGLFRSHMATLASVSHGNACELWELWSLELDLLELEKVRWSASEVGRDADKHEHG